jgi:hypothetical protein
MTDRSAQALLTRCINEIEKEYFSAVFNGISRCFSLLNGVFYDYPNTNIPETCRKEYYDEFACVVKKRKPKQLINYFTGFLKDVAIKSKGASIVWRINPEFSFSQEADKSCIYARFAIVNEQGIRVDIQSLDPVQPCYYFTGKIKHI